MTSNASARSDASAATTSSVSGTSLKRSRSIPSNPTRNPRNSRRPARSSPFTDFGSYMESKNQKLQQQFDADASTSAAADPGNDRVGIFSGVSIFVDGFTVPSSQDLKRYMLKHGGRFENYFSRHRVTHIICSHLPDSKLKNLRSFSRGLPVVKPAWILDSLAAEKLLSYAPYEVVEPGNGATGKQQKLSAFFTRKDTTAVSNEEIDVDGSGSMDEDSNKCSGESVSEENEKISRGSGGLLKVTDMEDEESVAQTPDSDSSPQKKDVDSRGRGDKALGVGRPGASNQPHSTLTDPNFVDNYFKNSRLHFIGTWRNRYRRRFSNFHSGARSINTQPKPSATNEVTIIHIDMDCFFVSVVIRNYPDLVDKPVAVCHSDNPKGTAEISSANYPARDFGIKAGMFVRDAKARCPHLVIVPYDFEAYEEVADQFYGILHKYCNKVQALSCDEAFLDVAECTENEPEQVALMIRKEIVEATRCTASAGIAGNLLLARLATKAAKPNGQCLIPSDKVDNYMRDLPTEALPGIGYAISEKLKSRQVETCGQLRLIPKESLQKDFGTKIGDMLWNYCRGIDTRTVEFLQKIKSVGAEVNWGVRFNDTSDCYNFLMKLCKEVSLRLQGCGVEGRTITLKIKKRKEGAMEPIKFMGHGDCQSISRSMTLSIATDNLILLQRTTKQLFDCFHVDIKEVRGVGLHISKLENVDIAKQGHEENALKSWLTSSGKTKEQCNAANPVKTGENEGVSLSNRKSQPKSEGFRNQQVGERSRPCSINETNFSGPSGSYGSRDSILPPLCHLDIEVIKNLPPEIFSEVNSMYNGKLHDLMEDHKGKDGNGNGNATLSTRSVAEESTSAGCDTDVQVAGGHSDSVELQARRKNKGKQPLYPAVSICNEAEVVRRNPYRIQLPSTSSCSRANDLQNDSTLDVDRTDLMPGSLSQADISVLEELPEDVKSDIFELLPAHRPVNCSENTPNASAGKLSHDIRTQNYENSKIHFFLGNPPTWVEKFKLSGCFILNIMAELHAKFGATCHLSPILQALFSLLPFDINSERWDEALSSLCELLTQYIYLKIDSDIEELYICFRLLKRCTSVSKFLLQVYNAVLPTLQASVSEKYGGELQLSVIDDSIP